jgi:hypothetical protein
VHRAKRFLFALTNAMAFLVGAIPTPSQLSACAKRLRRTGYGVISGVMCLRNRKENMGASKNFY